MTNRLTLRAVAKPLERVARRLHALGPLAPSEIEMLLGLVDRRERRSAGELLVEDAAVGPRPYFILSGWACRQRVLTDGRRQIFNFLLPGDGIAVADRSQPEPSATVALTAMELVDASPLIAAVEAGRAAGLAYALAGLAAHDQKLLFDHMVRLGRQTAYERVAHLLLELQRRLETAGLGDDRRFPLPLTQEVMGDALGLSIVHVNRTLQQLRRDGLIELRSGVAILLQPERLAQIAELSRTPPRAAAASSAGATRDAAPA